MEYLVKDGRIQPGRIEEVAAAKCKHEVDESKPRRPAKKPPSNWAYRRSTANSAAIWANSNIAPRMARTPFDHSMEVAYLTGIMAAELGLDQILGQTRWLTPRYRQSGGLRARRLPRSTRRRTRPQIQRTRCRHQLDRIAPWRCRGHFVIAHLVAAADTLSAARPGARSETLETYVKRIGQLERSPKASTASSKLTPCRRAARSASWSFRTKSAMPMPSRWRRRCARRLRTTMTYPGQIKVSVIREYRATETAK
jgi:ribonuclease Y